MVEYIPCYSAPAVHWSLLPVTRLASRKILIEQKSKSGQGQHSVYSVVSTDPASPPTVTHAATAGFQISTV
jgi:hypothetical protein